MKVVPTEIPDVLRIEPSVREDERGFFLETWNEVDFRRAGLDVAFVQDNHSRSMRGSLRGLHYQISPHAQGKLVRVVKGRVFDVAVDLRRSSATFGSWVGVWLSAEDKSMLWIPPGFAHGFYVTSPAADFLYKCTDFYSPEHERVLLWDDPDLAISWPLVDGQPPTLSPKDAAGSALGSAEHYP
jgi:dTDP-4-dehydrorhamnose 3,5-epimerase